MTNTPFSGSRYPEKWIKYIKMMINGVTLPKISDSLKIRISTTFYWSHKILNAIGSHSFNQLSGIIESDETFFRESLKVVDLHIVNQKNEEFQIKKLL